jgi:hypothetical protein
MTVPLAPDDTKQQCLGARMARSLFGRVATAKSIALGPQVSWRYFPRHLEKTRSRLNRTAKFWRSYSVRALKFESTPWPCGAPAAFGKPEVQVNFVPSLDCLRLVLVPRLSRESLLSKLLLHDGLEQQSHLELVPLLHGLQQGPHRTLGSSLCIARGPHDHPRTAPTQSCGLHCNRFRHRFFGFSSWRCDRKDDRSLREMASSVSEMEGARNGGEDGSWALHKSFGINNSVPPSSASVM